MPITAGFIRSTVTACFTASISITGSFGTADAACSASSTFLVLTAGSVESTLVVDCTPESLVMPVRLYLTTVCVFDVEVLDPPGVRPVAAVGVALALR